MWQEMPSCVVGSTRVSTPNGIIPISSLVPDGSLITHHYEQGSKPVYEIKTYYGFTLTCTADHRVKLPDGTFKRITEGLSVGDMVQLSAPTLGEKLQTVVLPTFGFMLSEAKITPDFAEFIGMYMGDGCFSHDTIGVSCDAQDKDTIDAVSHMMRQFVGEPRPRVIGSKSGGIEIRTSSVELKKPFIALGLIEPRDNNSGGMKRKIHVPPYIMQSPPEVVSAFIRGLFEADGSVKESGAAIRFFTKDPQFAEDVQLLLLSLGIVGRRTYVTRIVGDRTFYGNVLTLGSEATRLFVDKIGFISARKNNRAKKSKTRAKYNCPKFNMTDQIVSILHRGSQAVYDITTKTEEFTAGGIVVHNCPDECWQKSTEGTWYAPQMASLRSQGRIGRVPHVSHVPVNTFWDIGNSDGTAIWLHQRVGVQDRWIGFIEAWCEPYEYFIKKLRDTGYLFGIHYLPHDATQQRQQAQTIASPLSMLQGLAPDYRWHVVPRVADIQHGITLTRAAFASSFFDAENTKEGLIHLGQYKKTFNRQQGVFTDIPNKLDGHSEAADAFRQFAQGYDPGHMIDPSRPVKKRERPGAMTV